MISGMYLGEIVRLIILDLIDRELIFAEEMKKNAYRHALFTKGSFYTKYLNEIESDSNLKFTKTRRILKELAGIDNPSNDDCCVVKLICSAVTRRASKLTAAGKLYTFLIHDILLKAQLMKCVIRTSCYIKEN
jgi:hexokinase